MTTTDFDPNEFGDFDEAQGAAVAKENAKSGDFERELEYLSLKGDPAAKAAGKDSIVVRLVTEWEKKPNRAGNTPYSLAWISVMQHFAPTRHRPEFIKEGQSWPEKWNAVCRKDRVFRKRFADSCYICDTIKNKPGNRTWALAVEREEVRDEQGVSLGWRDKTREVFDRDAENNLIVERVEGEKKIYKKKHAPAWLLINMGYKNFFGPLSGQAQYFNGTVLDRDFVIIRSGEKADDTSYTFIPLAPITLAAGNPWDLPAGTPYDMGHVLFEDEGRPVTLAEMLYPEMPDLRRIIASKVSDNYYGRYFIPGWLPEGYDPNQQQGGGQQRPTNGVQQGYTPPAAPQTPTTSQGSSEATADGLAAFKARLQAGKQPAGS